MVRSSILSFKVGGDLAHVCFIIVCLEVKSSLGSVVCVLAFCSDGKAWSARDMQLYCYLFIQMLTISVILCVTH